MSIGQAGELWAYIGDECFYRIEIPQEIWDRLVAFSRQGLSGIPNWIDLGPAKATINGEPARRRIATDSPDWFTETYDKMMSPNAEF